MKVKFLPMGKEIEITPEKTLLQAALENHVEIYSICKGKLICGECRVKIVEGESNLLPPTKAELNMIGTAWQLDSRRYACQVRCFGDVTVDITEQVLREDAQRKNIRGFKSSRPITESKAVIDTMILNEKMEDKPTEQPSGENRGGGEQRSEGRPDNRPQNGGQGRQDNRNQPRGDGRGGKNRPPRQRS